jgi:hypothetical protein
VVANHALVALEGDREQLGGLRWVPTAVAIGPTTAVPIGMRIVLAR